MELLLTNRLSTLSHPSRMAVFPLLMRRCPDELPAGEIAEALGLKASTVPPYLSALTQADLISQRRDGMRPLYSANLNAAREVISGLFFDCCRGRADLCPPEFSNLLADVAPMSDKTFNILFVCTGNSARSFFAETTLRDMAGKNFNGYSAGTAQHSELNPFAVAFGSPAADVSDSGPAQRLHRCTGAAGRFAARRARARGSGIGDTMRIGIAKPLKIRGSRPASHRERTARFRSHMTKSAIANATRSRTALHASRTGGASQPVTTDARKCSCPPAHWPRSSRSGYES